MTEITKARVYDTSEISKLAVYEEYKKPIQHNCFYDKMVIILTIINCIFLINIIIGWLFVANAILEIEKIKFQMLEYNKNEIISEISPGGKSP